MNSLPPAFTSATFNAGAFSSGKYITKIDADQLYLPITAAASLVYLNPITAGTVSASKAMIVDASKNITGMGTISATITGLTDFYTVSNATTTGRITLKMITDNQTWEWGVRGSAAASNPGTMYCYVNGGYRLTMNTTGDTALLSATDSSSAGTGSLITAGGLGVAKNIYTTGMLTLNRNGSNLNFINGANTGLIELSASPNILRIVNGYALNVGALGLRLESSSTTAARYQLDFGNTSSDIHICLNQVTAGSTAAYGFGANGSALRSHTGGAFEWYSGTTASGSLGTLRATLSAGGNMACASGFFTGFTTLGLSTGSGLKAHYNGSFGQLFSYNYGTSTPLSTALGVVSGGNYHLVCTTNTSSAYINVNSVNQTGVCPMAIYGSGSFTRSSGSYGWLNDTGAGNVGSASFTRNFSLYLANGLISDAGEINQFSDLRKKHSVIDLSEDIVEKFMQTITPISYIYKKGDQSIKYGYSAQELIQYRFVDLLGLTDSHEEEELETQDITCDDGSVFHLPGDTALSINLMSIIPMLHKAIQMQSKRIEQNEHTIARLVALLEQGEEEKPAPTKKVSKRIIKRVI